MSTSRPSVSALLRVVVTQVVVALVAGTLGHVRVVALGGNCHRIEDSCIGVSCLGGNCLTSEGRVVALVVYSCIGI